MLHDDRFSLWCQTMAVSPQARVLLQQIRTTGPARAVRSAAGNVSGRYPSRKMGVTIQFESHRNELAAIYEFEHDAHVLEYYDQPPAIRLAYRSRNGRHLGVWHTPDFFVLREDAAGWEECKTEAHLLVLAEQSPARYVYD